MAERGLPVGLPRLLAGIVFVSLGTWNYDDQDQSYEILVVLGEYVIVREGWSLWRW